MCDTTHRGFGLSCDRHFPGRAAQPSQVQSGRAGSFGTALPSPASLLTASLIPGYFLEDFVDMLCNQKLHQSWELLFHHSVVSPLPQGQTLVLVPPRRLGLGP